MRYGTFRALEAIRLRWPIENGKIIQLLLGISLSPPRGGFAVQCRLSEGVDLELIRAVQKFAVEVKTTEGTHIDLAEKDIIGLRAKSQNDGYVPAVAALTLGYSSDSDWVVCKAAKLTIGKYTCKRLALDSVPELELAVRQHFDRTVSELTAQVLKPPNGLPQIFLSNILAMENTPAAPVEVLVSI